MTKKHNTVELKRSHWPQEITISTPASKSISNRLLILSQFHKNLKIENLSNATDVKILERALESLSSDDEILELDIKDAGTAMRFFAALAVCSGRQIILNGTERMQQRPIAPLLNALKQKGGKFVYLGNKGYPPLFIMSSDLDTSSSNIDLDPSLSSQFLSALMLISANFPNGIAINLTSKLTSRPYTEMTAEILRSLGYKVDMSSNLVEISPPSNYKAEKTIKVEGDWSSLVFWIAQISATKEAKITIKGLVEDSIQGDKSVLSMLSELGFDSQFKIDSSLDIQNKSEPTIERLDLDLSDHPDLAQGLAVICVLKNVPFHFSGLHTLRIKESDRISDLVEEFAKLGLKLIESDSELKWDAESLLKESYEKLHFDGHKDHRLVMALSAFSALSESLLIDNADCVQKSYPDFFSDLSKAAYNVSWT